ncbi:MAG: OmpA family protein [Bdellovibrionales bacterium]|nr:OmpA family protein [Bdellovibrionales bacterium]
MKNTGKKRLIRFCLTLLVLTLIGSSIFQRNRAPKLRSIAEIRSSYLPKSQRDLTILSQSAPSSLPPDNTVWNGPGRIEKRDGAFLVTLDDQKWFEPGSAKMNSNGIHAVISAAQAIKTAFPRWKSLQIEVQGHTNSAPVVRHRALYPSNWELSGSRAFTVVRLLDASGFPGKNLSGVGYADSRPEANGARRKIVVRISDRVSGPEYREESL